MGKYRSSDFDRVFGKGGGSMGWNGGEMPDESSEESDTVDGVTSATVAVAPDAACGSDVSVDFSDTSDDAPDATTGATPGVASACVDLGLSSVDEVVRLKGIKPPGIA